MKFEQLVDLKLDLINVGKDWENLIRIFHSDQSGDFIKISETLLHLILFKYS